MTPTAEAYRAARRLVIRQHHPDVGGDAESLERELAALKRRYTTGERHIAHGAPVLVAAGGPIRLLVRGLRTLLRNRPSRRTYIEI